MPVHLRMFYYRKLADAKEKENEAAKGKGSSSPPPKGPSVRPQLSGKVKMG